MIPHYEAKMIYLYQHQKAKCAITGLTLLQACKCDLHHGMHNSKWARKKFPLFINSLFNLFLVHHDEHMKHPSACKVTEIEATRYERFLEKHPLCESLVNRVNIG